MRRAGHLAMLLAVAGLACRANEPASVAWIDSHDPRPPGQAGPGSPNGVHAAEIAARVLEAMGGREAWEAVHHLHWRFFGIRETWWNRRSGDVRIETAGLVVLVNVTTRTGRAFRAGQEITDPGELAATLARACEWFANDSYWVIMPFTLLDPGVALAYLGPARLSDGRECDVLRVSPADGPAPRYDVSVARDTGLVEEWSYYRTPDQTEPDFTLPWAGWQRFGGVLLATDHGLKHDWDLAAPPEVAEELYREVAEELYRQPAEELYRQAAQDPDRRP